MIKASVYFRGVAIWVSSTSLQKSGKDWPHQPPRENLLKFKGIFMIGSKKIFFFKTIWNEKRPPHPELVLKFGPNFVISHLLLLNSFDLLQILISFHWCHPHEGIVWEKKTWTSTPFQTPSKPRLLAPCPDDGVQKTAPSSRTENSVQPNPALFFFNCTLPNL